MGLDGWVEHKRGYDITKGENEKYQLKILSSFTLWTLNETIMGSVKVHHFPVIKKVNNHFPQICLICHSLYHPFMFMLYTSHVRLSLSSHWSIQIDKNKWCEREIENLGWEIGACRWTYRLEKLSMGISLPLIYMIMCLYISLHFIVFHFTCI
jgi:hypothetical protein